MFQILGHKATRAIHCYQVFDADVNSVIRVVQSLHGCGIVLRNNESITELQGGARSGWPVTRSLGHL
jgi:hypothetical protein